MPDEQSGRMQALAAREAAPRDRAEPRQQRILEVGVGEQPDGRLFANEWLRSFDGTTLAQLEARAGMLRRQDNKYIVDERVLAEAFNAWTRSFEILEIGSKRSFSYETCYFDDAANRSYHFHRQGRRCRFKLRTRRYPELSVCFVELKLKGPRSVTVKKRLAHDYEKFALLDRRALRQVRAWYRELYEREFHFQVQPALQVNFERVALVAKQGEERITIDGGLRFFCDTGSCASAPGVFIVETKSRNGNGSADRIMRELHQHRAVSCSKYCVGMAALGKVSQYNRFLRPMRQLHLGTAVPNGKILVEGVA